MSRLRLRAVVVEGKETVNGRSGREDGKRTMSLSGGSAVVESIAPIEPPSR